MDAFRQDVLYARTFLLAKDCVYFRWPLIPTLAACLGANTAIVLFRAAPPAALSRVAPGPRYDGFPGAGVERAAQSRRASRGGR